MAKQVAELPYAVTTLETEVLAAFDSKEHAENWGLRMSYDLHKLLKLTDTHTNKFVYLQGWK